jgi:hypothetical protein
MGEQPDAAFASVVATDKKRPALLPGVSNSQDD